MQSFPRVAVIGAGNMGKLHARVLSRLKALVAIVDSNSKVQSIAERRNIPFFLNIKELAADIKPDGFIVATPTETHFSVVKEILVEFPSVRGILVEKPLTSSLNEAKQLKAIADNHPALFMVGHVERYNPVVERMLNLLKSKTIGEIRSIIIQRRGAVPEKRIPSVGDVFYDIGVHDFDLIRSIIEGNFKLHVVGVKGEGDICNAATVILSQKNGPQCVIHLSREFAGRKRVIEIEGATGTMIIDLVAQIIELRSLGVATGEERATKTPFREGERMKLYGEPLQEELIDFLECINTGKKPNVSLSDGISAIKLVEKAQKSFISGEIVEISL